MVIQFPDVYEALKQGVVDGVDLPPDVVVTVKFTEVIKYYIPTNLYFGWYMFIVNNAWYDKLPADVKGALTEAVKRASKESLENSYKAELAALKVFEKQGIKIVDPEPKEIEKMIDMTKSVYDWRLSSYKDDNSREMSKKVFDLLGYEYDWRRIQR